MRPLRLVLSLASCLGAILVLSYFAASRTSSSSSNQGSGSLGAYFNWQSSSLFPPSAIISLTDDNSTFFLARPANFGPTLPAKGLNGQLWTGSGFGDDLSRGVSGAEGELGCSDVPGWSDGDYGSGSGAAKAGVAKSKASTQRPKVVEATTKTSKTPDQLSSDEHSGQIDGTDDHLHHPLPPSGNLKSSPGKADSGKKLAHADIQSLQETAEIAGKVVLLTRGGCGFLEKVKWVQRRGGVGLIVGDNVRGGGLVTMYARGDTSNVTIPSLFTSHMTAHLLSSLVPTGSFLEDVSTEEAARLGLVLGDKPNAGSSTKPDAKQTSSGKQQQSTEKLDTARTDILQEGKRPDKKTSQPSIKDTEKQGWLDSLLSGSSKGPHQDTRRPPSSGKIDWIQQKNFEDEGLAEADTKSGKANDKSGSKKPSPPKKGTKQLDGGFVIGVQDWRDPDLLDAQLEAARNPPSQQTKVGETIPAAHGGPKGGSITPGSGEYDHTNKRLPEGKTSAKGFAKESVKPKQQNDDEQQDSWFGRLGLSGKGSKAPPEMRNVKAPHEVTQVDRKPAAKVEQSAEDDQDEAHDGLWVTLTPTSMSSSPFFDTLLVLVISPLVTLTIVYALLLLRSRIRRRRWRAPKSVVDRLPVRTYHTIASTVTSNSSGSSPSPQSPTLPTSSTPLLHSGARPISQGSTRPRSRTASEVPAASSSLRENNNSSLDTAQEKSEAGLAEWRRRWVGRQKECVVCLEEYVDGVSRVMSLPCGHEFHAECISPWLTTRRRTCPICKSDVVRSIGRSTSSPSTQPLLPQGEHGDSEEDDITDDADRVQDQVAGTRNDDPSSAEPVSREEEASEDLERGLDEDRSR